MTFVDKTQSGAVAATKLVDAPGAGSAEAIWVKRVWYSVETAAATGTLTLQDNAGAPVNIAGPISLALAGHSGQIVFGGPGRRCTPEKELDFVVANGGKVNFTVEYQQSNQQYGCHPSEGFA